MGGTAQHFISILLDALPGISSEKIINKGEYLLREGQIERNLYYIETGAVRLFHLHEFEELTVRFGYAGSFINSLSSFIKSSPSEFYIEAIRKSSIKTVTKEDLYKLVNENTENQKSYCAFLEVVITQQIEREIDLLTTSPSARLNRVLERSPNLFQQIPLKYIASYLRMTPETVSRIRNS